MSFFPSSHARSFPWRARRVSRLSKAQKFFDQSKDVQKSVDTIQQDHSGSGRIHDHLSVCLPCRLQPWSQLCRVHQLCAETLGGVWEICNTGKHILWLESCRNLSRCNLCVLLVFLLERHRQDQHGGVCETFPARSIRELARGQGCRSAPALPRPGQCCALAIQPRRHLQAVSILRLSWQFTNFVHCRKRVKRQKRNAPTTIEQCNEDSKCEEEDGDDSDKTEEDIGVDNGNSINKATKISKYRAKAKPKKADQPKDPYSWNSVEIDFYLTNQGLFLKTATPQVWLTANGAIQVNKDASAGNLRNVMFTLEFLF